MSGFVVAAGRTVVSMLPRGRSLSDEAWTRRHEAIQVTLWLHVLALAIVGTATGHGLGHSMLEAAVVACFAVAASIRGLEARVRASAATLGLVASSATLVHLSGGLIEMHFHFFVMVAVVTLYQSWMPFLLAIGFVVLHHGSIGILDAAAVYNHPEAIADPWKWALVHGLFIAGASVAGLAAWKLNELALDGERRARLELESANAELETANEDLAAAQALAKIGSWEWSTGRRHIAWSEELFRILGFTPEEVAPSHDLFLQVVHPQDRDRVAATVAEAVARGGEFEFDANVVTRDGTIRLVHAIGSMTLDDLGRVVKSSGTMQDITERRTLEKKIEHQAFHDALTGLVNRDVFSDRVTHALRRQKRAGTSLAVLFLDLDDFKSVNDSLGHQAGDQLLIEVARHIEDVLRVGDTVARLGGDEFAVLLEDLDGVGEAVLVADRLSRSFERPFVLDDGTFTIRSSIGIAWSGSDEAATPADLLRDADIAMYAAKRHGKGTFQLYESGMGDVARKRLALKEELQQAIDEEQLLLHFQPIVDVGSRDIIGVEALVRWNHPTRGLVPPLEFIPFAEDTGLIIPLGAWVLREACRVAAGWPALAGRPPLSISVNVSASRFRHPRFTEELEEVLAASGLPAERLVLEITETALMNDVDAVVVRLDELKRLGVQVAIDDFGTGYSSLSYLNHFPVDILKIDKMFIDSVARGAEESSVARAVLTLGRSLGMKVVAEGVEEEAQAVTLKELGCPSAQGYLFSRPIPAADLAELLRAEAVRAAAPGREPTLADAAT